MFDQYCCLNYRWKLRFFLLLSFDDQLLFTFITCSDWKSKRIRSVAKPCTGWSRWISSRFACFLFYIYLIYQWIVPVYHFLFFLPPADPDDPLKITDVTRRIGLIVRPLSSPIPNMRNIFYNQSICKYHIGI